MQHCREILTVHWEEWHIFKWENHVTTFPWDILYPAPLACSWSKMICHFLQRCWLPAHPFYLCCPAKCGILRWQICCEVIAHATLRIADEKPTAVQAKMLIQGHGRTLENQRGHDSQPLRRTERMSLIGPRKDTCKSRHNILIELQKVGTYNPHRNNQTTYF